MIQVVRIFTHFFISSLLVVSVLFSNHVALAAVTPQAAKEVIEQAKNPQEAAENLKALDSSEIVRNHGVLDTKKDVLHSMDDQSTSASDRRDQMIRDTQTKISGSAQAVKEKLDLN